MRYKGEGKKGEGSLGGWSHVWLVLLNKTGNTGGFKVDGGDELSFRHTGYEMLI